ncbi:MAG TPA: carboxypeptidase-like regulatory domain-containing protein [Pyrinomonadaceae bacterium]|nr:carboxypeptidase-like regulatory domain-containing protein [Pyrinomonadaceae bacterium]
MDHGIEKTSGIGSGSTLPGTTRVRFRERQLLRASDLNAEQSYLITTRRRHNIGQHGWGIVSGLELTRTPAGIEVQPGYAVDGYGRELIVAAPLLIPPDSFNALKQKRLDVWLFYDLVEANVPQRGAWNCGPGRNTRNRERASIRLTRAPVVSKSDGAQASRTPAEVPVEDLPFPPSRTSPDDPASEWPVYLGRIRRSKKRAIYRKSPRAYASLSGELLSAVSGTARMQVGSELESDTRRFAVSVANASGQWNERLAIDNEGNTVITGNTTIKSRAEETPGEDTAAILANAAGELRSGQLRLRENKDPNAGVEAEEIEPLCARSGMMTGEKPGSARMVHFESLAAEPAAAAPWNVYRTSVTQDKSTLRQLRFEIGHPGDKGDPKLSMLAFGARGGLTNDFLPLLTISADCTVRIDRDLEVLGELSQGPILPDPSDPDFTALIANQWAEGTAVGQATAAPVTIQGIVQDPNAAVIPGARVEVRHNATKVRGSAVTNIEGNFSVSGLAEGNNTVRVSAPNFITRAEIIGFTAGETRTIEITLTPTRGTIRGTVVDLSGARLPGVLVVIQNLDTGEEGSRETLDEGQFTLLGMPPARYRATTNAVGLVFQEGVLVAGGTLNFTLGPTPP